MATTAEVWPAAEEQHFHEVRKSYWRWPLPNEVTDEELPLRLDSATWADAERFQQQFPDTSLLKFLEERCGGLHIVDIPLERHEGAVFSIARDLTKWAVKGTLPLDFELLPAHSLPGTWPCVVQGRQQEADGGWRLRGSLREGRRGPGVDMPLILETAVSQSLEGAVNKIKDVWFQSESGWPSLAIAVKVEVDKKTGEHGFRAVLFSRDQECPLADINFGWGTGCDKANMQDFSLVLPLDKLYGEYRNKLPAGVHAPQIDLHRLKRDVLLCIEAEGVPVKEKFTVHGLATPSYTPGSSHMH